MVATDGARRCRICFWLLCGVLSLLQFRTYVTLHQANASILAARELAILDGHPALSAYQNRILGPAILRELARATGSARTGFLTLAALFIFAAHGLAGWLSLAYLKRPLAAAAAVCAFSLSYGLLFDPFSYSWDFLEVVLFLLFARLILERRHPLLLLALFAVAVTNRESSLLMGAWVALDAIAQRFVEERARPWPRQLGRGVAMIVTALAFTVATRRWLMFSPAPPVQAWSQVLSGNLVTLSYNLTDFHLRGVVGLVLLVLSLVFARTFGASALRQRSAGDLALAGTVALACVQLLFFGILAETRVFYTVQPIVFVGCLRALAHLETRHSALAV